MFWHFFGLATVLATLSKKLGVFIPNLLVALMELDTPEKYLYKILCQIITLAKS